VDDQAFAAGRDEIVQGIQALTIFSKRLKIRSPAKRLAAARGKIPNAALELAKVALSHEESKQVLERKYRSTRKSAAEGPNQRLQADLIDFPQNT
jgi:GTP cyclohydrolase III